MSSTIITAAAFRNTALLSKTNNGVSDVFQFVNKEDGSQITIHGQGAHVSSWLANPATCPGDTADRLYMSENVMIQPGKPLRGGVPIIFPQFSDMGPSKVHGIARVRQWSPIALEEAATHAALSEGGNALDSNGKPFAAASFAFVIPPHDAEFPNEASRVVFTALFTNTELRLHSRVTWDGPTQAAIEATNGKTSDFAFCFHTYFAVSDVESVVLSGFDGIPFEDNLQGRTTQPGETVNKITKEVDRNYNGINTAPEKRHAVTVVDEKLRRKLTISGENLPDIVLWNPHTTRIAKFADLPQPDGFKRFVCVEHGAIQHRVPFTTNVDGSHSWEGTQIVKVDALAQAKM